MLLIHSKLHRAPSITMATTTRFFSLLRRSSKTLSIAITNKKTRTKTAAIKTPSLPDHLKRRTRSHTQFDPSLYTKFTVTGDHVPVLLTDVLEVFRSRPLLSFVDCTLGAAGHSSAIIEMHGESLEIYLGLDVDPVAHEKGRARIESAVKGLNGLRAYTHLKNFKYVKSVLCDIDENLLSVGVGGMLMDLGMSSMQVNDSARGFSVTNDGLLDM